MDGRDRGGMWEGYALKVRSRGGIGRDKGRVGTELGWVGMETSWEVLERRYGERWSVNWLGWRGNYLEVYRSRFRDARM